MHLLFTYFAYVYIHEYVYLYAYTACVCRYAFISTYVYMYVFHLNILTLLCSVICQDYSASKLNTEVYKTVYTEQNTCLASRIYMFICNFKYVVDMLKGRVVTNVFRTCSPTPLLVWKAILWSEIELYTVTIIGIF